MSKRHDSTSFKTPMELDPALLSAPTASTLDTPRRLVDLGTGLVSLTSLFADINPIAEAAEGSTILYVHIPSCSIVEERFGWEALEAYRSLIANYLVGFSQELRRERDHCVLTRIFADDFVILTPLRDEDHQVPSRLADGMNRHLSAIDEETAALLQVYVGISQTRPFPKIHPERRLYRTIQEAQKEATDVGRQRVSAQLKVLDRCINREQFLMLYQPIVNIEDHSIFAYEALVRCQQQELKNPHILFNVAEQGNRIWPLSRLLRRISLDNMSEMPDESVMFVNLHPLDFDDPELIKPDSPLLQHASRLVLEVTERAAIKNLEAFRERLKILREHKMEIAIDDLGSGYSALSLVAELDPDYIKLDMTLIRDIDQSPVRQNLVRNMVSFAADLGARVVAEGVETREELQCVCDLGAQFVQGYFLSMPEPPFVKTITQTPAHPQEAV